VLLGAASIIPLLIFFIQFKSVPLRLPDVALQFSSPVVTYSSLVRAMAESYLKLNADL
jgi:hypothetical protein